MHQKTSVDNAGSEPRPRILLIAGSDSAGAAGLQADIATCYGLGAHPLTAITAVTAQHGRGVISANPTTADVVRDQIQAVLRDGHPNAIKIGLVTNTQQADTIIEQILGKRSWVDSMPVVWDPVMTSTSGNRFTEGMNWMACMLPHVDLVTPNIDEAEQLTGQIIQCPDDMLTIVKQLHHLGARGVWLKGGHRNFDEYPGQHIDLLSWQGRHVWLVQNHILTKNSRGTGCTLATATAVFLAGLLKDKASLSFACVASAVVLASAYVHQGLKEGYPLGDQPGPIAHLGWPQDFACYPRVVDELTWLSSNKFPDCGLQPLGLYPVIDSLSWLEKLLNLGIKTIQLRIKELPEAELEATVKKAVALCRGSDCRLFINDYWQLAIKYGAYGVHLGQEDIAEADLSALRESGIRLGISTHSEFEWARAASLNPSYLAIGAIYPTNTKQVIIVGENKLKRWVDILKPHFPLTAIGGINQQNLGKILDTGIDSAAVVSAITLSSDYEIATKTLLQAFPE